MSLLLAQRLGVKLGRLSFEWPRRHPSWDYERIVGEVKAQGHRTSRSSVARVSKENGIGPAPDRPSSWNAFIKAAWGENAAADFFTTEVWTPRGLTTFYTLFVIDLASRRVHVAGTTVALGLLSFLAQCCNVHDGMPDSTEIWA